MGESSTPKTELAALEAKIGDLTRVARRQTIAVWVLAALVVLGFASPWLTYLVYSLRFPDTSSIPTSLGKETGRSPLESAWDNDFHARPPQEQIQRASAILLTKLEKDGDRHREIVAEILKRKPGVKLYYEVGEEYKSLSHAPAPDCEGCEGEGSVVFMLGNPATMVLSMTYEGDRLRSLGDMPIAEIRRLVAESGSQVP